MTLRVWVCAALALAVLAHCSTAAHAQAPRAAEKWRRELTRQARLAFGLDAPIATLAGQIEQESGWREDARSPVGAQGIAQFMPGTAADLARKLSGPAEPLNATWALRAHSTYMKELASAIRYRTECDTFGAALSSYNGGLGWHNRRRALALDPDDFWWSVRLVNPGITAANQRENEEYPMRVVYERQPKYSTWGRGVCGN